MDPLIFAPWFRPQVWGGRRLADSLGKRLPSDGVYGESWEVSGHPLHVSRVAEGPLEGTLLTELWQHHRRDLAGLGVSDASEFPLLIKYLDCRQNLSVQVHPCDAMAREILGEPSGKCEAWVVLEAEPTARIYAGFRPGTTRTEIASRLEDGSPVECLNVVTPHPGDAFEIPAGTVHALGGGLLVAEIQQPSDATFRLFDWNRSGPDGRPRTLHVREALQCLDLNSRPAPVVSRPGKPLIQTPYFRVEQHFLEAEDRLTVPQGELSLLMLTRGRGVLTAPPFRRICQHGETLLLPASTPATLHAVTSATVLRVVPEVVGCPQI